jgi:cell division protein FtsN
MARDYKYRAQSKEPAYRSRKQGQHDNNVGVLRWMLITALIISFVVFLMYLRGTGSKQATTPAVLQPVAITKPAKSASKKTEPAQQQKKNEAKDEHLPPQFDFYTILPEKEVVVPDYEIKTRAREERLGEAKATKYIVQAGSFKEFKQADALRAKLALMGIESRVEKAKVGTVTWHRVKLGPYAQMSSVSTIKARLKQSGLDVIVTEVRG